MSLNVLIFSSNDNLYALLSEKIVRVLWALEITPVPKSPKLLYGIFDLQGKTIPVVSLRELLVLPKKKIELEDALIILHVHSCEAALLVDRVVGVFELEEEDCSEAEELVTHLANTHIVKYEERLTPVLDMDQLIDGKMMKRIKNVND
jgi:purine-binding chemotaxis protein CheW